MNIVLGVGAGIAAYKSAELVRLLMQQGHTVQVVMTSGAQEFVRPLTFAAVSGIPGEHTAGRRCGMPVHDRHAVRSTEAVRLRGGVQLGRGLIQARQHQDERRRTPLWSGVLDVELPARRQRERAANEVLRRCPPRTGRTRGGQCSAGAGQNRHDHGKYECCEASPRETRH